ncbi:MAG TPA: SDR family oxidoreductase [Patescibacteria group bacterium]|nr:SDR family oxidoreductase [Patescibacteria group bacterium]
MSAPQTMFDLKNQSALITGATGALGGAVAKALAAAGARLTIAGGNTKELAQLESEIKEMKAEVVAIPRRPDSPEDADAMVDAAVKAHGRLDLVLAASGMNIVSPIVNMPVDRFDAVMNANVRGSWLVCQSAGRQLLKQGGGGSVVLVSSTRGLLGHPAGYTAYCASKAAIDLIAKSLAAEWGPNGIRVNVIAPTVFRSKLTAWMYEDNEKARTTRNNMLSRIPLGRLAEPDDLVGPVLFFFSQASRFCTGQILYIDGGYTVC